MTNKMEYLKIKNIININKMKNKRYFDDLDYIDKFLIVKRKSDLKYLYIALKAKGIVINAGDKEIENVNTIKAIIENFPNKEIEICENTKVLSNNDIKDIYQINRKVYINNRYIEKRNIMARNEVYVSDISTYILIIDRIEFLIQICKKYFSTPDEQIMFVISQILKYIKFVDYHDYRTCLANATLLGTGVCIDFAITLYKCISELGYECELITGIGKGTEKDATSRVNILKKRNHAWNQIKINNVWYNIDITWFLTEKEMKWLLVCDKDFEANCCHITDIKEHYCRENYDRKKLDDIFNSVNKYASVWKEFEKGNRELILKKDDDM